MRLTWIVIIFGMCSFGLVPQDEPGFESITFINRKQWILMLPDLIMSHTGWKPCNELSIDYNSKNFLLLSEKLK